MENLKKMYENKETFYFLIGSIISSSSITCAQDCIEGNKILTDLKEKILEADFIDKETKKEWLELCSTSIETLNQDRRDFESGLRDFC